MAPIEQFFVTLNVATPDLFASLDKRKDKVASSYKPVRRNAAERAKMEVFSLAGRCDKGKLHINVSVLLIPTWGPSH